MRKHLILVIAAAAVLLSVTTAAVGSSSRQAAGPSGSATAIVPTDPGSLDPQLTIVGAARYVDTYAYDTLVNVTGPGKLVSGLAQSWKVVSPKQVQFTLFKGITCSDGTQMTATVVKQNLDFVGNPANKSPLLGLFMPIGATVTANNGTRTVTVTTSTPQPFMIQGLAPRPARLLEGAGRSQHPRPRHQRNRPVQADRRGSGRPLHLLRSEGLQVGPRRRHHRRRVVCLRR